MNSKSSTVIKQKSGQNCLMALSIRQPYAELILRGEKKFEYRNISTDKHERVYVYASTDEQDPWSWHKLDRKLPNPSNQILVGSVEIVACYKCARCPILKSAQVRILKALDKNGPRSARQLAEAATNGHIGWVYNFIGSKDRERDNKCEKRCRGSTLLGRKLVRLKRAEAGAENERSTSLYEITPTGRKSLAKAQKDWFRWKLAKPKRLKPPIKPKCRPMPVFFSPFSCKEKTP